MKSKPYLNVSDEVREVVSRLIHESGDQYHITHEARLARTIDLLYKSNPQGRMLEIGTSGLIPLACKELLPNLEIIVTDYGESTGEVVTAPVSLGERVLAVKTMTVDLEYDLLPIADETFDHVICCEVLEHMEIDPMFMLSEVNRVSKFGASLLLTTPNILSSRGITKMLDGYEPYFFMQYHANREYHRHNYEYSVKGVWAVLKCAGYDPTVWTEDLFEDGLTHAVESLRYAGFKIENVGDNIIAQALKVSPVTKRHPNGLYV